MKVIRSRTFDRRAKRVGLDEDGVGDLIKALVERPAVGAVIPGTGGARKVRAIAVLIREIEMEFQR